MQPATPHRDDNLFEAIGLLEVATKENRAYWQDILEARRLLTETPKRQILDCLRAPLGLSPENPSLFQSIKVALNQYTNARSLLEETGTKKQQSEGFCKFKAKQGSNLQDALKMARTMLQYSDQLKVSFEEHLDRLNAFLQDYQNAKEQGFMVDNRRYHSMAMWCLQRKIQNINELKPELLRVTAMITEAARAYENIVLAELGKLSNPSMLSLEDPTKLEKYLAAIHSPRLSSKDFIGKLYKLLEDEVSPIQ